MGNSPTISERHLILSAQLVPLEAGGCVRRNRWCVVCRAEFAMRLVCLGTGFSALVKWEYTCTKIFHLPARIRWTWGGPTREEDDHSNVNSAAEGEADDFPECRGARHFSTQNLGVWSAATESEVIMLILLILKPKSLEQRL